MKNFLIICRVLDIKTKLDYDYNFKRVNYHISYILYYKFIKDFILIK